MKRRRIILKDAGMNAADPLILAVVYSDGHAADRYLAELGYRLREAGVAVAGIVQHNRFARDRAKCDMELEELASGTVLRVSENRGAAARGCRLDHAALSQACVLLEAALAREPAILIVNKFGKTESEGRGTRNVLAAAVLCGVPMVIGVPYSKAIELKPDEANYYQKRSYVLKMKGDFDRAAKDIVQTANRRSGPERPRARARTVSYGHKPTLTSTTSKVRGSKARELYAVEHDGCRFHRVIEAALLAAL